MRRWAGVLLVGWVLWMGQPRRDGTFTWTLLHQFPEHTQQSGSTPQEFCESTKAGLRESPNLKRVRLTCVPVGEQPS
jgi:hypothetical protein